MKRPIVSDHWLRVLTVVVNLCLLGGFIFYAGASDERLKKLAQTVEVQDAGNRITAIETRVENLVSAQEKTNAAVWQLVMKLNKEQ